MRKNEKPPILPCNAHYLPPIFYDKCLLFWPLIVFLDPQQIIGSYALYHKSLGAARYSLNQGSKCRIYKKTILTRNLLSSCGRHLNPLTPHGVCCTPSPPSPPHPSPLPCSGVCGGRHPGGGGRLGARRRALQPRVDGEGGVHDQAGRRRAPVGAGGRPETEPRTSKIGPRDRPTLPRTPETCVRAVRRSSARRAVTS